jgi:pectate lyase
MGLNQARLVSWRQRHVKPVHSAGVWSRASLHAAGCLLVVPLLCCCGENTARLIFAAPTILDDAGDAQQLVSAYGTPIGYATVAAGDIQTTTGGGSLAPTYVASCAELKLALEDKAPRVVVIDNVIRCNASTPVTVSTCKRACDANTNDTIRSVNRVLPAGAQDCSAISGWSASDPIESKTRDETVINVASNKTLLGHGPGASITGANLYIKQQSNIIIQNLAFSDVNPTLLEAGDAITIDAADHVWVDHCSFSTVSDGFVDAINVSRSVTLSWNRFEGADADACAGQHNYASTLEGASVTFHHNFFDHTLGCSPKLSGGSRVHLFNNYWLNVLYYSVQVASESQAIIEGNDFDDAKSPFYASDNCFDDSVPCGISVPDGNPNVFEGISNSETHETGGTTDALPYEASAYRVQSAAEAKAAIITSAGPTLR